MPIQTVTLADIKPQDSCIRALIYGPAGAGKTTFIGTFPKPMLIFDFDQKLRPLYGIPGIEVVSYTMAEPKDASAIFLKFKRDFKEAKADPKWKTLAIDGITSFDIINLRHFVILSGKDAEIAPTLPVYQEQSAYYSFFLSDLKTIRDKHMLVTAHEYYNVDGESGLHSIQPLITGKGILGKLPAMFEEVYYLNKKGGATDDVVMYYRPAKKAVCTSLFLKGSGTIDNPTYDKLIAHKK